MTRNQFFDWAAAQDSPYEFDGFEPVTRTGGNLNHNRIAFNVHAALPARLKDKGDAKPPPTKRIATSLTPGQARALPKINIESTSLSWPG